MTQPEPKQPNQSNAGGSPTVQASPLLKLPKIVRRVVRAGRVRR